MTEALDPAIAELLAQRINSFEKLEIVIALHGASSQTLSINHLSNSLKLSRDAVRAAAAELREDSLVTLTTQDHVQLLPPSARDAKLVGDLSRVYQEDRLAVVKTMLDVALSRIRNMTATANIFANAFVLSRKKDGDG